MSRFAMNELAPGDFVFVALLVAAGIAGCVALRLRDQRHAADEARKVQDLVDSWHLTDAEAMGLF